MTRWEHILVERGLITEAQLNQATANAVRNGKQLALQLVDEGYIEEEQLLKILAEYYGIKFLNLRDIAIDESAIRSVPARIAVHYSVAPVKLENGVLTLAVNNPLETAAIEDIETNLGFRVERVLACRRDIREALQKYYGVGADTVERILSETDRREEPMIETSSDLEKMAEDASVIRLVNELLSNAITDRATDIHFEPHSDGISIRRRIDGILYDASVPRNMRFLFPAIVSRIKLIAGLNIVEKRLPQDGRARVRLGSRDYDLRVSIIPAMYGEDVVIRILPTSMLFDLSSLGFSEKHLQMINEIIAKPHGILFVTGPTGSGKSTTLYACLSKLNTRDRKIITIEDPVEYELRGVIQTQVNPAIGLTFARALRSMLRHDPDVMMIGEVRDHETAEIAIQTALTGHLVLSTLHTNDSASAAVRLIDMGIEPYLITSTVLVFIAQRLVRKICPECKTRVEEQGKIFFRGRGCRKCNLSGYYGRTAISEFLPLLPEIRELILNRASAAVIRKKADSMQLGNLLQDGMDKVEKGITTPEEVLRVVTYD